MIIFTSRFLGRKYRAITLWPFLLISSYFDTEDSVLMNHESVHAAQQKELLILFFYIWYIVEYLLLRLKYNHDLAYRNIIFEKEAYAQECNQEYLNTRSLFSFLKYYKKG